MQPGKPTNAELATGVAEVKLPDLGGPSLRPRLRAPSVLGGLLPVDGSRVTADMLAGITLAAVSIPLALGYAEIAGMPVVTGLYTLLIPMAVFAVLGSSRHLVVGPDSATAAMVGRGPRRARGRWLAVIRAIGRACGPVATYGAPAERWQSPFQGRLSSMTASAGCQIRRFPVSERSPLVAVTSADSGPTVHAGKAVTCGYVRARDRPLAIDGPKMRLQASQVVL